MVQIIFFYHTEHTDHHKLETFFEARPNYNHQNKQTLASGQATLDAIAHFNSVQI